MFLFYLYLYSVILISLIVSYTALAMGLDAGLELLMGVRTSLGVRQTVASSVGVFVVAAPLWLAHWLWLRRSLPDLTDPKFTFLNWVHRFYLYAVLGIMVLAVLGWGSAAATSLVGVFVGAEDPGPQAVATFGTRFGLLFLSAVLWVFHWQELAGIPAPEPTLARVPSPGPAPAPAATTLPPVVRAPAAASAEPRAPQA